MNKSLAVILTNSYVNVDGKYPKRRLLLFEVFPWSSDFNVTVAGYVLRLPPFGRHPNRAEPKILSFSR